MSAYGTAAGGLPVSTQEDGSPVTSSRRIAMALGVAGIFGMAMLSMNNHVPSSGMNGLSTSEGAAAAELSVANKIKPVEKPLYGEMIADDIAQLFAKFQSEYGRGYADDEDTAFRFEQFKKNLQLIDSLNNQHPYALFDVTRFADYTDDERAQRRMKGNFADYEQMKAQLPD
eukprot:CAMPEP_0119523690 /NCGR_PEP_ID=MMETSP1344-20130328/38699_1 /TAXON_ID=236787 /ORGANISM="Florenciella parvula, Strain CCMP2471" /LENGTH=171 /DNA_ID=CAMNT_0007561967 /DNA_START=19 /DNA_END=531 /DNA_ORIENTATION=-